MCGIIGLVTHPDPIAVCQKERMSQSLASLRHRGPDSCGEFQDRSVWLGHVRLSILDLTDAGHQPMRSADGRYVISYNGETYNFRDISKSLGLTNLYSRSDTEIVLRAFAEKGTASFMSLNGMFAFALYDRTVQKLWLVRDRLGIKPLYFHRDNARIGFSSEIRPLLMLLNHKPVCDLSAMHEWLYYGNSLGGRTLLEGIQQILPGHYLELDIRSFTVKIQAYWSLQEASKPQNQVRASTSELIDATRDLLEKAVARQLVSDVPVGIFLSGGVDSSAITAFASRHYGSKLATYAAGFDDPAYPDERPKAKRVATLFGTDHHEMLIQGEDVAHLIEILIDHHGVPFFDAANIPLYRMAEQISRSAKVVMQGDGGDEVFGGYRRYVTLRFYRWLHRAARPLKWLASFAPPSYTRQRFIRYFSAYGAADLGSTIGHLLTSDGGDRTLLQVFSPALATAISAEDPLIRYRSLQQEFAALDIGQQMSMIDLMVVLPDLYLEKVDRATMANSLEVRVPFLDHDLIDYVARIPGYRKMPFGRKKWLLKKALKGILPDDVLFGPKTGFNVPCRHWLLTSLREFFFDHVDLFEKKMPKVIQKKTLMEWYHLTETGTFDYSSRLWKLLNFVVWCNRFDVEVPR